MTGKPPNLPDRGSATRRNLPEPRSHFVAQRTRLPAAIQSLRSNLATLCVRLLRVTDPRPNPIRSCPIHIRVRPNWSLLKTEHLKLKTPQSVPSVKSVVFLWCLGFGPWVFALRARFAKRTQFQSINTGLSQNNEPIYMPLKDVQPPSHPGVTSSSPAQTYQIERVPSPGRVSARQLTGRRVRAPGLQRAKKGQELASHESQVVRIGGRFLPLIVAPVQFSGAGVGTLFGGKEEALEYLRG
jgi:hypothetical protein